MCDEEMKAKNNMATCSPCLSDAIAHVEKWIADFFKGNRRRDLFAELRKKNLVPETPLYETQSLDRILRGDDALECSDHCKMDGDCFYRFLANEGCLYGLLSFTNTPLGARLRLNVTHPKDAKNLVSDCKTVKKDNIRDGISGAERAMHFVDYVVYCRNIGKHWLLGEKIFERIADYIADDQCDPPTAIRIDFYLVQESSGLGFEVPARSQKGDERNTKEHHVVTASFSVPWQVIVDNKRFKKMMKVIDFWKPVQDNESETYRKATQQVDDILKDIQSDCDTGSLITAILSLFKQSIGVEHKTIKEYVDEEDEQNLLWYLLLVHVILLAQYKDTNTLENALDNNEGNMFLGSLLILPARMGGGVSGGFYAIVKQCDHKNGENTQLMTALGHYLNARIHGLAAEAVLRRAARKSSGGAIMARNTAHHLGSHVSPRAGMDDIEKRMGELYRCANDE